MMIQNIQIRSMENTADDLQKLSEFLKLINDIFPIPLTEKVIIEEYAKKLLNNGIVLCAEDRGIIVGIIAGYNNNYMTYNAFISVFGVLDSHRSKGLGKQLFEGLKQKCVANGMKTLALSTHKSNINAIHFYKNNGCEIINNNSRNDDDIYMILQLNQSRQNP